MEDCTRLLNSQETDDLHQISEPIGPLKESWLQTVQRFTQSVLRHKPTSKQQTPDIAERSLCLALRWAISIALRGSWPVRRRRVTMQPIGKGQHQLPTSPQSSQTLKDE
eukprot:2365706-Amphidinium_carterae.1